MTKLKLHLDADASQVALQRALVECGHDVSRTPTDWMPLDASDDQQLLGAIEHGRCIMTFNARDFIPLAKQYPHHLGVILSPQKPLSQLISSLDNLLSTTEAEDWKGQVRWLNDWF